MYYIILYFLIHLDLITIGINSTFIGCHRPDRITIIYVDGKPHDFDLLHLNIINVDISKLVIQDRRKI